MTEMDNGKTQEEEKKSKEILKSKITLKKLKHHLLLIGQENQNETISEQVLKDILGGNEYLHHIYKSNERKSFCIISLQDSTAIMLSVQNEILKTHYLIHSLRPIVEDDFNAIKKVKYYYEVLNDRGTLLDKFPTLFGDMKIQRKAVIDIIDEYIKNHNKINQYRTAQWLMNEFSFYHLEWTEEELLERKLNEN
jgi:hypothetical protein